MGGRGERAAVVIVTVEECHQAKRQVRVRADLGLRLRQEGVYLLCMGSDLCGHRMKFQVSDAPHRLVRDPVMSDLQLLVH